jgi:homoprotocatechuate degradation regulator HpaR
MARQRSGPAAPGAPEWPPGAMRQFDRSLPMALLRAREAVMQKFSPALREQGLSPQQWRVIRALVEEDGLDASELSQRCFLLLPSLSRILQKLAQRGLIERRPDAGDARRSLISLAGKGRDLFETLAPVNEARYAHITERFGYGKLELLYELLDELVEKLDEGDEAGNGSAAAADAACR